jgi:hypothetical protein
MDDTQQTEKRRTKIYAKDTFSLKEVLTRPEKRSSKSK